MATTTSVAGYGNLAGPRAGMPVGQDMRFESKLNPTGGAVFLPGMPVFIDTGTANSKDIAYHGLSTDASLIFLGVAALFHTADKSGNLDNYPVLSMVNVQTKDTIVVPVPTALSGANIVNEPVYAINIAADANYEKFTNAINDGTNAYFATGAVFRSNAVLSSDGITYVAEIELKGRT